MYTTLDINIPVLRKVDIGSIGYLDIGIVVPVFYVRVINGL